MLEVKMFKATDRPEARCQSVGPAGQCTYEKMPGIDYCINHGYVINRQIEKAKARNYNLQIYQREVNTFADSNGVKSLREEIGILRLLLQTLINRCKDDYDLLMASSKIADLAAKIEKLVVSCHKLEESLQFTLDKSIVINISTQIVQIISEHIHDQEVLDTIISKVLETVK